MRIQRGLKDKMKLSQETQTLLTAYQLAPAYAYGQQDRYGLAAALRIAASWMTAPEDFIKLTNAADELDSP